MATLSHIVRFRPDRLLRLLSAGGTGGDGPRANTSEKGRCCRYSDGGFSPFGRTYEAPFSQPNSATLRGAAGPEPKMIWIPTPGCWC